MTSIVAKRCMELKTLTGCNISLANAACVYAGVDMDLALAFIKSGSLSVATPGLTVEERIRSFYKEGAYQELKERIYTTDIREGRCPKCGSLLWYVNALDKTVCGACDYEKGGPM